MRSRREPLLALFRIGMRMAGRKRELHLLFHQWTRDWSAYEGLRFLGSPESCFEFCAVERIVYILEGSVESAA